MNPHCRNHTLRNIKESLLANTASKQVEPGKEKVRKNTKEISQKRDGAGYLERAMPTVHAIICCLPLSGEPVGSAV